MTRTLIISTFILLTTLGFGQCEFSIHPEEANGCQWAYEDVVWTNITGVQVSGNQVSQTGGGAWQAGCSSTGTVYSEGFAFTIINRTNMRGIFRLSTNQPDPNYASIDYDIPKKCGRFSRFRQPHIKFNKNRSPKDNNTFENTRMSAKSGSL